VPGLRYYGGHKALGVPHMELVPKATEQGRVHLEDVLDTETSVAHDQAIEDIEGKETNRT